jgi:hypothetical protein
VAQGSPTEQAFVRPTTSPSATAMKVAAAPTTRTRPCEDDTVEFVVLDDSNHRPKGDAGFRRRRHPRFERR